MSFSQKQAVNAITYYARTNRVDPIELLSKASEFNLDSALKIGKNNSPALNIEIPVNLKGLGAVVEADTPRPPGRQGVDKATQSVGV
jgi:hypothetical protein